MITFKTPTHIGIGIARGTTCCLIAETRPHDIYIQKDRVQISEHALQPYAAHGDPGRAVSAPQA